MYVKFEDPTELRRGLLTASKEVVEMLQKYEQFKLKRIKKFQLMVQYKDLMNEVEVLCNKLKKILPKVDLPKPRAIVPKESTVVVAKERNKLRDLDVELKYIESKLSNLS